MASDLGVGFVPAENLEGKAEIVLLSWKPGASLIKPWTWFTLARALTLVPSYLTAE